MQRSQRTAPVESRENDLASPFDDESIAQPSRIKTMLRTRADRQHQQSPLVDRLAHFGLDAPINRPSERPDDRLPVREKNRQQVAFERRMKAADDDGIRSANRFGPCPTMGDGRSRHAARSQKSDQRSIQQVFFTEKVHKKAWVIVLPTLISGLRCPSTE